MLKVSVCVHVCVHVCMFLCVCGWGKQDHMVCESK